MTRREFIKALGALTGAAAAGSVIKPEGVEVNSVASLGTFDSNTPFPAAPFTSAAWVDDDGKVILFDGTEYNIPGKAC